MDIKNIRKEDGKLRFQSIVDAQTFEGALNKAYLKAKKNITVPGFRKGKAPRMIIEGMYGSKVFYEDAIDLLALEAYQAGAEEAKERTVGDPAITNYDVAEDKTLTIDFEAALYPEVTLGQYKGIEAAKEVEKVAAADVNKELESVRKRNARIVTVERAAKEGDTVNLDYDGFLNGERFDGGKAEGHDLVLGSGSFVPGFEEQIVGLKAGDERDIDITFPENYHEGLAGKAVVFKIKVNEVKESQLPELDDEFAKDVSEFDTLKEYKASIKKELTEKRKTAAENAFRDAVLTQAIDNMTVTIPDVMIDERVNALMNDYARNCAMQGLTLKQYFSMMGADEATFRGYIRPNAENELKSELLLEKVAEVEGLTVSPEEIEEEYKKAAETYNVDIERVKASVAAEMIERDLKLKKAAELIVAAAVVKEKAAPAEKAEETESKPNAEAEPAKKPAKKRSAKKPAEEKPAEE